MTPSNRGTGSRGQAFTIESVTASVLLLTAIIFALQVTALTPLSASTSNQHIQNQQRQVAAGLLDSAVSNESLREAVLFWNESEGQFHQVNEEEGFYVVGGPPGITFGAMINRTFRERGVAVNVNVWYIENGKPRKQEMVHFGEPSDNAVSARRTLVLFDDDRLTAPNHNDKLSDTANFYASDTAPESGLFNVLRVEVIVWRM